MKKRTLLRILALFCCAAMLVSCQNPEQIPVDPGTSEDVTGTEETNSIDEPIQDYVVNASFLQYYNGCLYFHKGSSAPALSQSTGIFSRYNIETGNLTSVCPDPLCMHNTEECPFAGRLVGFIIRNNTICYQRYFKNNSKETLHQFCAYDIENMKLKVLLEQPFDDFSLKGKQLLYNNNWYYYQGVYDEETKGSKTQLWRQDITSGKITVLADKDDLKTNKENGATAYAQQILFILNDRIYFTDIQSIYSTDMELGDRREHVQGTFTSSEIYTDGEYIYYAVPLPGQDLSPIQAGLAILQLYRVDFDGQNVLDLGIQTTHGEWCLTENYIYYQTPNTIEVPYADADGSRPFYSDRFFRCGHDGSDKEQVFDMYRYNEESGTLNKAFILPFWTVAGDHIYAMYEVWEDLDGDGCFMMATEFQSELAFNKKKATSVKILKINVTDGSHEILEIE